MDILENMANSTNIIAEGEVMQLEKAGDPSTTEEQYLDIINRKTATLFFSSACFGAAVLNGAKSSTGSEYDEKFWTILRDGFSSNR